MHKSTYLIYILLISILLSKNSFAQEEIVDVITLKDKSTHIGKVISNSIDDTLITFSLVSGDSLVVNKKNILDKTKLKYEFKDQKILVVNKNPYSSSFLSFLLPGLGQFYNEEYWKGTIQLGLVTLVGSKSYGLLSLFEGNFSKLNISDYIIIADHIWSIIDSPFSSMRTNTELRNKYDYFFKPIENQKNLNVYYQKNIYLSYAINF